MSAAIRFRLNHASLARERQGGFVLIVGLVILLVLTILGVAAMQGTTLQEHMAGNSQDRQLAFQAAEAGLNAGEQFVLKYTLNYPHPQPTLTSSPAYTNCAQNTSLHCSADSWVSVFPTGQSPDTSKSITYSGSLTGAHAYYMVEQLNLKAPPVGESAVSLPAAPGGGQPSFYRVTAEGVGKDGHTSVVLQSVVRVGS